MPTNISASGGLDLLQVYNFIDDLVKQKRAKTGLETVEPTPGGQLAINPKLLANPYYAKAIAMLQQTRGGESSTRGQEATTAGTRSATDITSQSADWLGKMMNSGGKLSQGALDAITQNRRNLILQQTADADTRNAATSARLVPAHTLASEAAWQNSQTAKTSAATSAAAQQDDALNSAIKNILDIGSSSMGPLGKVVRGMFSHSNLSGNYSGVKQYLEGLAKQEQAAQDDLLGPGAGKTPNASPVPPTAVQQTYDDPEFLKAYWKTTRAHEPVSVLSPNPMSGGISPTFLPKEGQTPPPTEPAHVQKALSAAIGDAQDTISIIRAGAGEAKSRTRMLLTDKRLNKLRDYRERIIAMRPVAERLGVANTKTLDLIQQQIDAVLGVPTPRVGAGSTNAPNIK